MALIFNGSRTDSVAKTGLIMSVNVREDIKPRAEMRRKEMVTFKVHLKLQVKPLSVCLVILGEEGD